MTPTQYRATLGPKLAAAELSLGITALLKPIPVPDTYYAVECEYGPRMAVIKEQARLQGRTNALASVMSDVFSWTTQLAAEHD